MISLKLILTLSGRLAGVSLPYSVRCEWTLQSDLLFSFCSVCSTEYYIQDRDIGICDFSNVVNITEGMKMTILEYCYLI